MKRKSPVKVQIWVTEWRSQPMPHPSWKTQAFTGVLLVSAIGMIVGGGWLAIQLIINPTALSWLSHLLPISSFSSREPETLAEIQAEIRKAGNIPGSIRYFSQSPGITQQQPGFQDMLLPIGRPLKSCDAAASTHCQQIIELRVYRSVDRPSIRFQATTYELIDRLAVQGPEELATIAALTDALAMPQGTTRTLPLTDLNWMTGKAPPGIWFQLSGEWKRGSRVLYGQVFRYDPDRRRLNLLQTWSSEAAQLPQWRQVTGNSTSELVVNRSIGLEPQFQVFQVKSSRSLVQPLSLEPISLTEAVLPAQTYHNALLLARHGLWSTALQRLKSLKQTLQPQGYWSAMAQAQMDLIALHANVTKTQADRNWASPSQQILAQVMDDRWSKALNLLQSAHKSGYDVKNLLASNADRLWKRVETALRVNPQQLELQQWGALMVAVQQNRNQALIWLRKQPQVAKKQQAIGSIEQTLALLDPPQTPDSDKQTPKLETTATRMLTGLIGSVQPIDQPQPKEWLFLPANAPTPSPQSHWYRVQVVRLQDQADWQKTIADLQKTLSSHPQQAQSLWQQLGLEGTSLQIVSWKGATPFYTIPAEIKAVQLNQGTLSLLTTGEALPQTTDPLTSIAITPNSISWASALSTQTLSDLAQQHPDWSQNFWPQLWQSLENAQLISPDFDRTDPLATLGDWSVQQMELTGDQSPEALLTLENQTDDPEPHTLIFSAQGQILYSDLQTDRSLVTIADQADHPLPVLILSTAQGLKLQQWSAKNQRFE